MVPSARQLEIISAFRDAFESAVAGGLGLSGAVRDDRPDAWTLVTRWPAEPHFWYEVTVRPGLPQVRVGILTDDADRSRDLVRMINEAGLTRQEFVAQGLAAAGLDWPAHPVEQYRESGDRFCIATPIDLRSIEQLADDTVRDKVYKTLDGYRRAFFGA